MQAPLWSTITLFTELCVSAGVYTVIWKGYREGVFLRWLAFGVLIYETLFNITYMSSRLVPHVEPTAASNPSPVEIGLAIFHGIFSILMFALLIVFFIYAARRYGEGRNYFREKRTLTSAFAVAWAISVLTGIVFYFQLYVF